MFTPLKGALLPLPFVGKADLVHTHSIYKTHFYAYILIYTKHVRPTVCLFRATRQTWQSSMSAVTHSYVDELWYSEGKTISTKRSSVLNISHVAALAPLLWMCHIWNMAHPLKNELECLTVSF